MGYKILLADDHPLILKGTKDYLNELGFSDVLTADDGLQAYSILIKEKPDVLIVDFSMPKLNGLELAKLCKKEKIKVQIIVLTLQKNELILKEIDKTINAYLLKEDALDNLKEAIEVVRQGKSYVSPKIQESSLSYFSQVDFMNKLTSSEIKILKQIARNKTSQEIANALFISTRTVEKHRSNIIQKLDLSKSSNSLQQFVLANKSYFEF